MPRPEPADGGLNELRQVTFDEAGVLACELDLTTERQLIANENARADDEASGVALSVRVSDPCDERVIVMRLAVLKFKQAEIAIAVTH